MPTPEIQRPYGKTPVAKAFGIKGIGEGYVWNADGHRFKTKGPSHKGAPRKERVPRAALPPQVHSCIAATFLEWLPSLEEYLREQGLDRSVKSIGKVLPWATKDLVAELPDYLNYDEKMLRKAAGTIIAHWMKQ